MGGEKDREGGERRRGEVDADKRGEKSENGEREKERKEEKKKGSVDAHQTYGMYVNKTLFSSEGYQNRFTA